MHFLLIFHLFVTFANSCCVCITIIFTILSRDDPKDLNWTFWHLFENGSEKEYDFGVVDFGVVMAGDLLDDKATEPSMATGDMIDDKARDLFSMNGDLMVDEERESLLQYCHHHHHNYCHLEYYC